MLFERHPLSNFIFYASFHIYFFSENCLKRIITQKSRVPLPINKGHEIGCHHWIATRWTYKEDMPVIYRAHLNKTSQCWSKLENIWVQDAGQAHTEEASVRHLFYFKCHFTYGTNQKGRVLASSLSFLSILQPSCWVPCRHIVSQPQTS